MRAYKKITILTGFTTIIVLVCSVILHYWFIENSEINFWLNVFLAVFGSALLTTLTSWVTYFYEKRQMMEGFAYSTRRILRSINHYQRSFSLEDKIKFFLAYSDESKDDWDMQMGNMDFFFEKIHHNRKYIYENIYMPILTFNQAVGKHIWHFRWYMDGTGKNEAVMEGFIKELEDMLIEEEEKNFPVEFSEDGIPIRYGQFITTKPKLVKNIQEELNGKYFECMYGKKIKKKAVR